MTIQYLLDTNTVSFILKSRYPHIQEKLASLPMEAIGISSITEAELLFGLAKRKNPERLQAIVHEFLLRVEVLTWDSKVAETYAKLRYQLEQEGLMLSNLDLLIAAHAQAIDAILVTQDQAFFKAKHLLKLEDWTR